MNHFLMRSKGLLSYVIDIQYKLFETFKGAKNYFLINHFLIRNKGVQNN